MRAHGKRFFDRFDWAAFWVAAVVTFVGYALSLGPSVGLEDSGELVTAAAGLGVPHPPGYPLWTLLSWCFCKLFGWVTWQGWPNPAWAVALGSATMGALAVGITALLIVRSGRDLLAGAAERAGEWWVAASAWVGGVAAALAFAFSPVMWSQAVIAEVYALGAFFLALTMLLTYMWIARPRTSTLVWLGLVFGLGLTNYQVLLLAALPIGLALFLRRWRLGLSFVAVGVPFGLTICLLAVDAGKIGVGGAIMAHIVGGEALWAVCWRFRRMRYFAAAVTAMQIIGVAAIRSGRLTWEPALTSWRFWWPFVWDVAILALAWRLVVRGRCVALTLLTVQLGLAFYLYMPIASSFGPAMDWGYTREWAGFSRAVMRGQYEALAPSDWLSLDYLLQLWRYLCDLCLQFSVPVVLLGVAGTAAIAGVWRKNRRGLLWLGCTALFFLMMSALLVALANPTGDLQDDFVQKVKFISSYGIFALWVGYGLAVVMVFLRRWRGAWGGGVALACLTVAAPLIANFTNEDLIRRFGAAEQTGHDFGWQFGAYMLEGSTAIRAELAPDEEPLPDPFWPPPMEQGAILFGGTDPGRFVPTYLVHAVGFRRDLHVLTQNALADPTYLTPTRRLYPDLTLPTDEEQTLTTAWMVHQAGGTLGATLRVTDSRVIWQTNGALAWNIFQANPERAVYVEASQWIPWMDDHLEPAGLAMRLNRAQGDLEGLAARNADFWEWMARRLAADEAYRRDFAARRAFSSLSVSIAGLYARKGLFPEAETAFRQAFALYPTSAQVINDTVQGMLLPQYRVNEALRLVRNHRKADPGLAILERVEAQLLEVKSLWDRRVALMEQERTAPLATEETLALARLCEKLALYGADAPAAALTAQAVACRERLTEAPDLTAAQARESFVALSERQAHEAALAMLRRVPPELFADFSEREAAIAGALAQTYEEVPLAKQVYKAAVARHKQSASLWLGLGLCYYYGRDGEKAYAALLRARQLDAALIDGTPGVQDVLRYLAERYGPRKGS